MAGSPAQRYGSTSRRDRRLGQGGLAAIYMSGEHVTWAALRGITGARSWLYPINF
jgi:hypothetical protein